jgi:hypothetical protein
VAHFPTPYKLPHVSDHHEYDIFEVMSDGAPVWRAYVIGMRNLELRLRDMARETNNKLFALDLRERSEPVVGPYKSLES